MSKVFNILKKLNTYEILLFIFVPIFILMKQGWIINTDSWFMLNVGKYIYSNGFPHVDIFSMHSNLNYVVQQWAYDVTIWPIYKWFGNAGIYFYMLLLTIIIFYLLYKLCMIVSDKNKKISILISSIIMSLLCYCNFIASRPQLFSYIFLILLLIVWEEYLKSKNWKILFFLLILSILQINFHASMWWFLIIYSFPFLAYLIIRKEEWQIGVLFIVGMIFCGLINPYGIDAINYLFNSYNSLANLYIIEMKLVSPFSKNGLVVICLVTFYILHCIFNKKREFDARYFFLTIGSFILGFLAVKSTVFSIIVIYQFASYFKKYKGGNIKFKDQKLIYKICYFIVIFLVICVSIINGHKKIDFKYKSAYEDVFTELKDKVGTDDVTLYSLYNYGSYAEFIGFKSFIDTRAELYYASMNGRVDIFNDYFSVHNGSMLVQDFLDKYKFTHLFIVSDDSLFLYKDLDNYHIIMEDDNYRVYERDDYNES